MVLPFSHISHSDEIITVSETSIGDYEPLV